MARIVPANKYIRKGVDEGEYADAGITESLRQLRRRVQGTAEKGLGAAGRTPTLPSPIGGGVIRDSRPSRMASVIGLESSGSAPRTQRGCSRERTAKVGWYHERRPLVPVDEGFLFFGGAMTIQPFKIIESTLREGEQFGPAHFTPSQKIAIAEMLDEFGVEYLELTSPCASPQSEADLRTVAALPLRAKVLTHVRCHLDDARVAIDTGADGIDVLFGTSSAMREFSHGKTVDQIIEAGTEVVRYIQSQGLEVRFSSEDSFRSEPRDLLRVYQAIDRLHPQRVGLADTVGIATPNQVCEMVGIEIPFNAAITGDTAFHHKAGMHTNAVLNDPSSYEIFDPARFGRERTVMAGHRLTGRHAIASRASTLGLTLTDRELRALTAEVKRRADAGPLSNEELDDLLRGAVPA